MVPTTKKKKLGRVTLRLGFFNMEEPQQRFQDITLAASENKFVSVINGKRINFWRV